MRKTILLFCLLSFTQLSFCQTGNFSLGLASNIVFALNKELSENNYLSPPGIIVNLNNGSRITTEIGLSLERKNYPMVDRSTFFVPPTQSDCGSFIRILIQEEYFHLNQTFKFYFLNKKSTNPFLALGYSLRFVHDVNGIRQIKESGIYRYLNHVENDKIFIQPGAIISGGLDFFINDKLLITTQLRWNYFFKNNLNGHNPTLHRVDLGSPKYDYKDLVITIGAAYIFPPKNKNN